MPADIPDFCDFDCPHAEFPPAETSGLCRTMAAVRCKKLKELVNKNSPCQWKKRRQKAAKAKARKKIRKKRR